MQTLRRPKVRDQVAGQIQQYIVDQNWGHQLIVDELAKGRVAAATVELRKHIESHKERI